MPIQTVFSVDDLNHVQETNYQVPYVKGPYRYAKTQALQALKPLVKSKTNTDLTEISSFSDTNSKYLSAFNLKYKTPSGPIPVENLFQAAKHFEKSGCQTQFLTGEFVTKPYLAKQGVKELQANEKIDKFQLFSQDFPIEPQSLFYNYLYCKALNQHPKLQQSVINHNQFDDINFSRHPGSKGINCQAEACAITKALSQQKLLNHALQSIDNFKADVYDSGLVQTHHLQAPSIAQSTFAQPVTNANSKNVFISGSLQYGALPDNMRAKLQEVIDHHDNVIMGDAYKGVDHTVMSFFKNQKYPNVKLEGTSDLPRDYVARPLVKNNTWQFESVGADASKSYAQQQYRRDRHLAQQADAGIAIMSNEGRISRGTLRNVTTLLANHKPTTLFYAQPDNSLKQTDLKSLSDLDQVIDSYHNETLSDTYANTKAFVLKTAKRQAPKPNVAANNVDVKPILPSAPSILNQDSYQSARVHNPIAEPQSTENEITPTLRLMTTLKLLSNDDNPLMPLDNAKIVQPVLSAIKRGQAIEPTFDFAKSLNIPEVNHLSQSDWDNQVAKADDILQKSAQNGIHMVSPFDNPNTDDLTAKLKKSPTHNIPVVLYGLGNMKLLNGSNLAIIGTRDPTDPASTNPEKQSELASFKDSKYVSRGGGKGLTEQFAKLMTQKGYNIVNGLADGVDNLALKESLRVGGQPIAIISNSLDAKPYPASTADTRDEIIKQGGLILTEYPFGQRVNWQKNPHNPNNRSQPQQQLVDRDLLQVELSDGVMAIETGQYGGTTHAINAAHKLNVPVAVPDPSYWVGTNINKELPKQLQGPAHFLRNHMAMPLNDADSVTQFGKAIETLQIKRSGEKPFETPLNSQRIVPTPPTAPSAPVEVLQPKPAMSQNAIPTEMPNVSAPVVPQLRSQLSQPTPPMQNVLPTEMPNMSVPRSLTDTHPAPSNNSLLAVRQPKPTVENQNVDAKSDKAIKNKVQSQSSDDFQF